MIATIKKRWENAIFQEDTKAAIEIAKEICKLFPLIKKVQPKINFIETGMGTWSFMGEVVAFATEEEHKGELVTIDPLDLDSIIRDGNNSDWYDIPCNKELERIIELVDFLIGVNDLNCSTWQHGFNENGVVFLHSETSNQGNPFSTPNMKYWKGTDYYRGLIRAKVPVIFEHDK